jgi:hypothetical protein
LIWMKIWFLDFLWKLKNGFTWRRKNEKELEEFKDEYPDLLKKMSINNVKDSERYLRKNITGVMLFGKIKPHENNSMWF